MVGHYDGITSIDAKNDCRYLITNSKDQSIKLWDVRVFSKTGAEHRSFLAQRESNDTFNWDYRYDSIPRKCMYKFLIFCVYLFIRNMYFVFSLYIKIKYGR